MALFRYTWRTFSRELTVLLAAAVFSIPLYLLITISLKSTADSYLEPLGLPLHPNWSSYRIAATGEGAGAHGMADAIVRSVVITAGSVVMLVALGSLAGYALARRLSRLGSVLYFMFLIGIVVPPQLGLVPLYTAMRALGLTNTYVGMIVLYTGLLMPLTVFLYAGFVRTLPRDYEEAAQVDGASQLRTFFRVVLPLLLPVTGTVAVITGFVVWNDFFTQLIFLSGSGRETLPVAIYTLAGANLAQWNVIFAAAAISLVPMLLLFGFVQRSMVHGFAGGVKG